MPGCSKKQILFIQRFSFIHNVAPQFCVFIIRKYYRLHKGPLYSVHFFIYPRYTFLTEFYSPLKIFYVFFQRSYKKPIVLFLLYLAGQIYSFSQTLANILIKNTTDAKKILAAEAKLPVQQVFSQIIDYTTHNTLRRRKHCDNELILLFRLPH